MRLPVRPEWLGLIFVGGSLGTGVRAWLETAFGAESGQWPWATFCINLVGAFLLGGLLEALGATGRDRGWRRGLRLGLGTGMLGGFTTYSTFSVEVVQLLRSGAWLLGVGYGLASVLGGVLAAILATIAIRRLVRRLRSRGAR